MTTTATSWLSSSALASGPFRRLFAAGLVSDLGDWLLFIALPLVVLRLSGSALGTSLAFLLELLPAVVLAPLVARIVTRFERRILMVAVTIGQALSLVPLFFVHDRSDLPLVYLVIVLQASLGAVFEPAKNSLLPDLVGADRIVSANALVGLGQNLGRLIGGPLGGVLLAFGDLRLVAIVDVSTYVVAAALLVTLPSRPAVAPVDGAPPRLSGLLADRRMRGVFLVVFVSSIAQGLFVVLFVFFVTSSLHGSDADVGLLRGIQAVGAIAAGLVVGLLASRFDIRRLAVVGVGAFALISLVTWNLPGVTTDLWPYVVLFIVVGAPGVLLGDGLVGILQLGSEEGERGHVFTVLGVVLAAGQAIGMLTAGLLQGVVGTVPLLELQGGMYVLATVLAVMTLPRLGLSGGVATDRG
ncbi:MAG: Major facilitator superfamily 1 [Frondihabitans sp.]|nr:Major facilitator superfamily 1 [Frondihabitans sp.]